MIGDYGEQIAERLVFGSEKLKIIGPPHSGKSYLVERVAAKIREEYADAMVLVDGRRFTEENQRRLLEGLESDLLRSVDSLGNAVLLFDHFEKAMRRTAGRDLQRRLFALLINSDGAARIGCLFAYRGGALSSLRLTSSPFTSRLKLIDLPRRPCGVDGERVGDLAAFYANGCSADGEFHEGIFRSYFADVVSEIASDLSDEERTALLGAGARGAAVERVSPFVSAICNTSSGALGGLLTPLVGELEKFESNWPQDVDQSVARLLQLLRRLGPCYWFDKFLLSRRTEPYAQAFFRKLQLANDVPLRLLVWFDPAWTFSGEWGDRESFVHACKQLRSEFVDIRIITDTDARLLHDRHLKARFDSSAFLLPQGAEVVCAKRTGNSNAGETSLSTNYDEVWLRASQVE